jgi:mannose-6-phosphate isomerase-like protein (cupin superfamily)
MSIKKINEKEREWESANHEDPKDPGVWKKVIVKHEEVDSKSNLMMINLCKVPVGKTHKAHSHETMEEIFYFTEGVGMVKIDDEIVDVGAGDRVIVPAKSVHQVKNTGDEELLYIGLGIAFD